MPKVLAHQHNICGENDDVFAELWRQCKWALENAWHFKQLTMTYLVSLNCAYLEA